MALKISLKQIFRAPVKLICYFLVLAFAAALLCIGLNLNKNAQANIAAADEAFTTVAVPSFYAHIENNGKLCENVNDVDYIGYKKWAAENYEFQPILDNAAVKEIDTRGAYGAMVNDGTPLERGNYLRGAQMYDVVIFTVEGEKSFTVSPYLFETIPVKVEFSAVGNSPESYRSELMISNDINFYNYIKVKEVNGIPQEYYDYPEFEVGAESNDGSILFEPGKKYIAFVEYNYTVLYAPNGEPMSEPEVIGAMIYDTDMYHDGLGYYYSSNVGWTRHIKRQCPEHMAIAEYNDDFFNTPRGEFYKEVIDAYAITAASLTAITTNNAQAMPAFHSGGVHIGAGRMISAEEYAAGAKVCLVSSFYAEQNGWNVGDKLKLSLYNADYSYDELPTQLLYNANSVGFFDEGEYEIIGIYEGNVLDPDERTAYSYGEALRSEYVLIPKNSAPNAPQAALCEYNTTIVLQNALAQEFVADMEAAGLLAENPGGYQLEFAIDDQNYSHFAPGLEQLSSVSGLTLILSVAVAGVTAVLLAVVHGLQKRREMAAMRSLGAKRAQAIAIAAAGIIILCVVAAAVGAFAGGILSERVTELALQNDAALADEEDETAITQAAKDAVFTFIVEQDASLAAISAASIAAIFALAVLLFAYLGYNRPPMLLLGEKE